ncbi:MAG: hypothetical protein ACO1RX_05510 [Candidatus Sericytochromatia bacterium]
MTNSAFDAQPDEAKLAQQRAELQHKLRVRERLLAVIEARLEVSPNDPHQRFLQEEHLRAQAQLQAQWQQLQIKQGGRQAELEQIVETYLSAPVEPPIPAQKELEHSRKTWLELIDKVRQRLLKRPGDPRLMQLLAEHQGRLLAVEQSLRQARQEELAPPELVLEQVLPANESEVRSPAEREMDVLRALIEKTQERLRAKPELSHLKGLIAQHESRLAALERQSAEPAPPSALP